VKVKCPGPSKKKRPGACENEGKSKTRLQILPCVSAAGRSRLNIVQKSFGVIFAQSLSGNAKLGCLADMGRSTEVEIEPGGSLPEGWAALAGHLALKVRSERGKAGDVAGAARVVARRAEMSVKVFMVVVDG
jgi:hypothetical protein